VRVDVSCAVLRNVEGGTLFYVARTCRIHLRPIVRRVTTMLDATPPPHGAPRSASEPALAVECELALYGTALALLGWPHVRWTERFIRNFRLVRTHLGPIRSRAGLAASFGREAFSRTHAVTLEEARTNLGASAVHAAYAVRWLELDPAAE
jgi:hypothetical protein